jgi:hypothetical protein
LIGKQRKKKKKSETFIIYNQKEIFKLRKVKKNNKLFEVSKSCTDGVILPLFSDNYCAKNELEGMIVNYEAPMNIRFDTKEKWRTKFKNKNSDEKFPNNNLKELELEKELEVIRDVSQQSTDGVILPLISDNYSAKNELDGMIVNYEAPMNIQFDVKEKWRTKFRKKNDFDEQLPNDNLMELNSAKELEAIRDVSQQGTDGVILPLIDYYCAKNEPEGIVFEEKIYEESSLVEKERLKVKNKEVMLQFLIR